jgi:mono/diheme cytochrome c family protein
VKRALDVAPLAFFTLLVLTTSSYRAAIPEGVASPAASTGKHIFNQSCSACHDTLGTTTKPGPGLRNYYRRQPRPADAAVSSIIQKGKGKMPAFSALNHMQISDLVAYIKTL